MLGRSTSLTVRGYSTPRPGLLAARPRSLLARAFARNSVLQHMDWVLVLVVLGLTGLGTLLVWSATQPSLITAGQDPRTYLKKQVLNVVIGLVLMFAVSLADSRQLRAWTPLFYAATLLGLMALLSIVGNLAGVPAFVTLVESLRRDVRGFATGTIYATAVALFGGTTQPIVAWLDHVTGNPLAIAWYLMAGTLVALVASVLMPETVTRKTPSMRLD